MNVVKIVVYSSLYNCSYNVCRSVLHLSRWARGSRDYNANASHEWDFISIVRRDDGTRTEDFHIFCERREEGKRVERSARRGEGAVRWERINRALADRCVTTPCPFFSAITTRLPSATPPPSDSLQRSYVVFENTCRECLPCERDDFPPVIAQDKYAFDVKYASDTFSRWNG